ncbi:SGNH/GDSL hydrolase family protein [Olivibacter sp. CPCC 100613]|uniref:SGNH/GDSL hydrolase family protein n=1 Tax=Olivibacter sp. CPCC 100613 TaxID=3079931 RepID=UPI002FFA8E97
MKRFLALLLTFTIYCSFTEKETVWLALGDSITYLNDHLDETGNRVHKGYMTRVVEKKPSIRYVNQGHNGWTAVRIAKEIENLGLVKADIYTIFLGTNDWWAGLPLGSLTDYQQNTGNATVFGAFKTIINKIRQLNARADIVLITPMQRTDFVYINDMHNNAWGSYKEKNGQQLEQFANAIRRIGKLEGVKVIDLFHNDQLGLANLVNYKRLRDPLTNAYKDFNYPDYTHIPFNADSDEYPYPIQAINMTYDGLHPSDDGNQLIAEKLLNLFNTLR